MIAINLCNVNYSDFVDNLFEINKKEFPKRMGKKIELECDFIGLENHRVCYRCKKCKNKCYKSINGLMEKFPRIYQFSNDDLNKFVFLLRKGVYSYEYIDSWERFDENSLPDKKAFYSELNLLQRYYW